MSYQSLNEDQKIKMNSSLRLWGNVSNVYSLVYFSTYDHKCTEWKKNLFTKGLHGHWMKKTLQKCLGESVLICRAPNSFFSKWPFVTLNISFYFFRVWSWLMFTRIGVGLVVQWLIFWRKSSWRSMMICCIMPWLNQVHIFKMQFARSN